MSLDILFIHPNASKKIYQELSKDHSAYEPPIWAGMLANHCRSKNFKTAVLDCEVSKLDYEKSAKEINNLKPKIACFVVYGQQPSASSQNMEGATKTSIELKKLNKEIVQPKTSSGPSGERVHWKPFVERFFLLNQVSHSLV